MSKINVRSPYYVVINQTPTATANLKIWTGASTPEPSTNNYELSKDSTGGYGHFEVAELVRDEISHSFDGTYTSYAAWLKVNSETTLLALDGYTEYSDGTNAQGNIKQLISNSTIWIPKDVDVRIPVLAQSSYTVTFKDGIATINTVSITSQSNTNAVINYATSTIESGENISTIEISGGDTITVRQMECSKYDAYKIVFVNKHGAFQDLYFFKKAVKSISTTKDSYKANTLSLGSGVTYDTTAHQYNSFDVLGKEKITLSTGYVSEDYNEPIKEMMLSEKVWMVTPDDVVVPVNVATMNNTFKTSLNDKLVAYDVEFDYAHDAINNVR